MAWYSSGVNPGKHGSMDELMPVLVCIDILWLADSLEQKIGGRALFPPPAEDIYSTSSEATLRHLYGGCQEKNEGLDSSSTKIPTYHLPYKLDM